MLKCSQITICKNWFWLDKSKNFGNIPSGNIACQGWPNIKTLLRNLHTKGDFPNGTLPTGFIMLDKAERAELTELQPTLVLKYWVKNSIPISVVASMDQCTFHDKTWQTFQHGSCTFFLFPFSMKLIGFQEHLLTMICFLQRAWQMNHQHVHLFPHWMYQVGCLW